MENQPSVQRARDLFDQILQYARALDRKALLEIDADPETEALLGLLGPGESRQASVHLQGARVWRRQQNGKARGKLDAAETALGGLDVTLARGILRKIDPAILDDSDLSRYDELVLAVEARRHELEGIQDPSTAPASDEKRESGSWFWRR